MSKDIQTVNGAIRYAIILKNVWRRSFLIEGKNILMYKNEFYRFHQLVLSQLTKNFIFLFSAFA